MSHAVNLGKIMALVLINKKQIARSKIIKSVIDQKLFAAGNGKINFAAVVNMDRHWLFVIIQMGSSKCLRVQTGLDCCFAGIADFHQNQLSLLCSCILT